MKHISALLFVIAVLIIMLMGSYQPQDIRRTSIPVVATAMVKPELVEPTLTARAGIVSAKLTGSNVLEIEYDQSVIALEDLAGLVAATGFQLVETEESELPYRD